MSLRFASNLSFMFAECPNILGRYKLAKDAGFAAVETGFPLGCSIEQVVEAKTNADVQQVLINVFTGDTSRGQLGYAAFPGQEKEFEKSLELTILYAKALNCKKIHIMSGKVEFPSAAHDEVYVSNMKFAAERLASEGIVGLIEPINGITVPNYYMNNFEKGLAIVKEINSPHLKLMLDVFHLQHCRGNITNTIKDYFDYIGHIQVAQVPDRNEPDTPGEIDYKYVFALLDELGYKDYVGLEYKPKTTSVEGLKWIQKFGLAL